MKRGANKQEACVAAFLKTRAGVLLVGTKRGNETVWGVPVGRIEPNETPNTALKRIMWERTGLLVVGEGLYNVTESSVLHRGGTSLHRVTTLFRVRKVGGSERASHVRFFLIPQLQKTILDESTRRLLKSLLK